MRVELAINPFDADVRDMVAVAQAAEAMGVSAVWVADHFSGAVVNRRWSRDPFVVLGAIAARTTSVHLGVLVANMMNRHVAHLASSLNTLQSVAPDRVRCGIGSGAAPNSQFAVEQDMVGTQLGDLASRRTGLVDTIEALRVIWSGGRNHPAAGVAPTGFRDLEGVVDGAACPPMIIGASTWGTVELAAQLADGVFVRDVEGSIDFLRRLAERRPDHFDVSVLTWLPDEIGHSEVARWAELGVEALVFGMSPPHDPSRLGARADLLEPGDPRH